MSFLYFFLLYLPNSIHSTSLPIAYALFDIKALAYHVYMSFLILTKIYCATALTYLENICFVDS